MPINDGDLLSDQPTANYTLPWCIPGGASWLGYDCWVQPELDAGMALHKALPQSENGIDTLATVFVNGFDFTADGDKPPGGGGGVNLNSLSKGQDTIQRMATSTYRFMLIGWGLRAGYQVPIPGIYRIGGQTPVPEGLQRAFNRVVGNLGGIPVWYAEWELHYIVSNPLGKTVAPIPPNMAARIRGDVALPKGIALPFTALDNNAVQGLGGGPGGGGIGGGGGKLPLFKGAK